MKAIFLNKLGKLVSTLLLGFCMTLFCQGQAIAASCVATYFSGGITGASYLPGSGTGYLIQFGWLPSCPFGNSNDGIIEFSTTFAMQYSFTAGDPFSWSSPVNGATFLAEDSLNLFWEVSPNSLPMVGGPLVEVVVYGSKGDSWFFSDTINRNDFSDVSTPGSLALVLLGLTVMTLVATRIRRRGQVA